LLGHPNPEEVLTRTLEPLWVGLGPRRIRVVENAILVPNGGILDSNGQTLPDGQLRRFPQRQLFLGEEQLDPVEPVTTIPGDALYLGWLQGQFGHFLVESMARWWAAAHMPQTMPRLWISTPGFPTAGARALLASFDLDPAGSAIVTEPTRVHRLLIPDPMFEIRHFIHEDAALPFQQIGEHVCGMPPLTGQPLYLSRSKLPSPLRRLQDEDVFEEFLREQGVLVVHPETLPVSEQLRLVRSHRVIIGPWGTALHLTNFSVHQPHVYMLTGGHIQENYPLWADALGTPLTGIVCMHRPPRSDPDDPPKAGFDLLAAATHLHDEGLVSNPGRAADLLARHTARAPAGG
jgi:hypothetical protein